MYDNVRDYDFLILNFVLNILSYYFRFTILISFILAVNKKRKNTYIIHSTALQSKKRQ